MMIRIKDVVSGKIHVLNENHPALCYVQGEQDNCIETQTSDVSATPLEAWEPGERCYVLDKKSFTDGKWSWWLSEVMESESHAPGPWTLDGGSITDSDGRPVFTIYAKNDWTKTADANLVVKAPELLAMLKKIAWDPAFIDWMRREKSLEDIKNIGDLIRAAEGRTS